MSGFTVKPEVTRVEVIDDDGRQFVRWGIPEVALSYQDDGRTLKIFLKGSDVTKDVCMELTCLDDRDHAAHGFAARFPSL
jgi:hypothetical protein